MICTDVAARLALLQVLRLEHTLLWQVLRLERYNELADVWSYGCVLEELCTHATVYDATALPLGCLVCSGVAAVMPARNATAKAP